MAGDELFEWDPDKAVRNLAKHGVPFDEASTVFGDTFAQIRPDGRHSHGGRRFAMWGRSERGRVLVVLYTERGPRVRLISARRANRRERETYEHGSY